MKRLPILTIVGLVVMSMVFYGYFWFRDGGPGGVDQWGNRSYTMDPWQEFDPADKPPVDAGYFTMVEMQAAVPVLPLTVESGDLTID